MDYKVKTPNGDTVRYKLLDGNSTPEKVKIRLVTYKGFVHTPYIDITVVYLYMNLWLELDNGLFETRLVTCNATPESQGRMSDCCQRF
jgi:hypothetical protein